MPLLGRISELAQETLVEAKLIKGEEGPTKIKKYVEKLLKNASKPDKTELCRMSNHEIFFMFIILVNDNNLSFDETFGYCEEVKKAVNSWTYDKHGKLLNDMMNGTNNDGSIKDYKYLQTMTDLGLTPVFVNYSMKLVYMCMYEFLKLKKEILTPQEFTKKLPFQQRIQLMSNIYRKSTFYNFVDVAKKCLERDTKDHEHRQSVSSKRIAATKEVIEALENGTLENIYEFPNEWHQYLDPYLLEQVYEVVLQNLAKQKIEVEKEEQELLSKKDKSSLTKYLYSHNLNPYSLNERLEVLEEIPDIINRIEFLKSLDIPINNILTIYYEYLMKITEDQIKYLTFFIGNGILSRETLKNNLSIIDADYQRIISNYEILKEIVDFQNIFYDDKILLTDIKEIKRYLSILKEYKLTKNNFIFLLCNFKYLNIYDLVIENDIPESLFISICETENPLNTIKRILIYKNIGENIETPSHFLKKDVTSESKFICPDDELDNYLPNIINLYGLNILTGNNIDTIVDNPIVKQLDEQYKVEDVYLIGTVTISRPKFLRNFQSIECNVNYLIPSLVSNSIIDETSYLGLITELTGNKLKK